MNTKTLCTVIGSRVILVTYEPGSWTGTILKVQDSGGECNGVGPDIKPQLSKAQFDKIQDEVDEYCQEHSGNTQSFDAMSDRREVEKIGGNFFGRIPLNPLT